MPYLVFFDYICTRIHVPAMMRVRIFRCKQVRFAAEFALSQGRNNGKM